MAKLRKPSATTAPSLQGNRSIDNLLRKMQLGLGYDPLLELVAIAKSNKSSVTEKIRIAQELMSYVYPKVKSIATDPNLGDIINITVKYDNDTDAKQLESSMPTPLSDKEIEERQEVFKF